jgi:predicted PurR-regulated permease PerM
MTSPSASRRFLLFLLLAATGLFLYVAAPFAKPILVAATLAAVLRPWHVRLTAALRGRRGASAGILTVGVLAALLGPLGFVASTVIGQLVEGARWLRGALASEGVTGLLARLPAPLQDVAGRLDEEIPRLVEHARGTLAAGGGAAAVGGILTATGAFVAGLIVTLVALYFLLAEGGRLVDWLDEVTPLERGQLRELLDAFDGAVVAVVVSALATAGVQALLAFVGYLVAGVPHPAFFAFVTFVAALVPLVGATIVVLPVAGLWAATGHPLAGGLLAIWAVLAVGTVDNVLKPVLMRRGLAVHVSLIFLALLGGLATFGPVGFLVGPLALAFFIATLRIWRRGQAAPAASAQAPAAPAPPGVPGR